MQAGVRSRCWMTGMAAAPSRKPPDFAFAKETKLANRPIPPVGSPALPTA
jgi:hypothetical protein